MNNIFEGAKFGDKFLTDGNEVAIYQKKDIDTEEDRNIEYHTLITPTRTIFCYNNGGYTLKSPNNGNYDIISRYQEPINEGLLDDLAHLSFHNDTDYGYGNYLYCEGFKAGYHKAMEK